MSTRKALLIDITKCIGCRLCEQSCRELHGQPLEQGNGPSASAGAATAKLTATSFTVVEQHGDKYVRRMCQHCEEPACASACLVGAITKTSLGPVVYDAKKCIGCRYCMLACPYQVPKYEWNKLAPYVTKCDMCYGRIVAGQPTKCAEVCPVGATVFGGRDELLREASKRMAQDPSYVQHVYGATELGGSSVLYLTDVPFEKLGFVVSQSTEPLPALSHAALKEAPTVVLVGGSLMFGLHWIIRRRREVLLVEGKKDKNLPEKEGK
jgi:formate dehydrogenase iron-sulfur subunit